MKETDLPASWISVPGAWAAATTSSLTNRGTLIADPISLPEPGGDVIFTVEVVNTTDGEPVALLSLVDSVYGDLDGLGTCLLPQALASGSSYACDFAGPVAGDALDSQTHAVTGTVEFLDGGQLTYADSATVTLRDMMPTFEVTKTALPRSVPEPGGEVVFSVRIRSTSPEDVFLVSLDDDVHGNLDGLGTCSVPQTIESSGEYRCAFKAMMLGEIGDSETDIVTAIANDNEGNAVIRSDSATVFVVEGKIFSDGFESGDWAAWSYAYKG